MCLIARALSQSAGYELLQWSLNLSVRLIASDVSRYAGYDLFQWSYSVCSICPDPFGLSRSARSGLVTSFGRNRTTCNNRLLRSNTCERVKDPGYTSACRFQPRVALFGLRAVLLNFGVP